MPRRQQLIIAGAAVLAAALYAPSLRFEFVWDDRALVVLNPWLTAGSEVLNAFTHHFWAYAAEQAEATYYRPLVHVVFFLLRSMFGPSPIAFHALVVGLHVLSTVLVGLLAARLGGREGAARDVVIVCATVLFATHPVHVEAVGWVSGVCDTAATACVLATLWVLVSRPAGFTGALMVASLVVLGTWFKETGVVSVVAGFAWLLTQPQQPSRRVWALALLVGLAVALGVRSVALAGVAVLPRHPSLGVVELVLSGLAMLGESVSLLVAPLALSSWHPFVAARSVEGRVLAGLLFLVFAGLLSALAWRRREPAWALVVALGVGALAPGMLVNRLGPNALAERYLYLPSTALCLGLGLLAGALSPRSGRVAMTAALVLAIAGAVATSKRLPVWHDDLSLFQDIERETPLAPLLPHNLGVAWLARGHPDTALKYFLRTSHGTADYWANRGVANAQLQQLTEAERCFREALTQDPHSMAALTNLCRLERLDQRFVDAEVHCREAVRANPRSSTAHEVYAALLLTTGRVDDARAEARQALELDPTSTTAKNVLAAAERR